MNAENILNELNALGLKIKVDGEELRITGLKGNLRDELVHKIKLHKSEIVKYLKSRPNSLNETNKSLNSKLSAEICNKERSIAKPLDFSIFYFGNSSVDSKSDIYKLLLDGAKYADVNGYTAVWTPERHFNEFGGLFPSPSVIAGALSTITKNIKIRAGSVVIPLHNPIRMAEEWAVIDNLSRGRAGIACAPGWQVNDFVLSPNSFKDRHRIMYESIECIRKLWRGEVIDVKDGNDRIKQTRIFPLPIQTEIPLWITSRGSIETFESAGKFGFNILTHLLGETLEDLAIKIKAYRKAYSDFGHDLSKSKVVLMLHTFLGKNLDDVYEKSRLPFISYLKTSLGLIKNHALSLGFNMESEKFTNKDLEDILEYSFRRYVSHASLIGTKDTSLRILEEVSSIGVNEIACLIDFGVDYDSVMGSLDCLTDLKDDYNLKFKY